MRLARDWVQPLLDTWPPTVRLSAPADGATVTGPLTLAAAASETAGVAGIQFLADGAAAGAEDTAPPYEVTLDTTRLPNGRHALAARARTASGRTSTSEAVTVTVDNPPPAPCVFVLGFQHLSEVAPPFMGRPVVGACLENEQHRPASGETTQRTAAWHGLGGLLVWRRLDNWTGFTDGHRTWISGPYGLEMRLNTERLCWESDAAPGTCLPSGGRPAGT